MRLLERWDKEIKLIMAHPECINDWEKGFVSDIAMLREDGVFLQIYQSFKLREIYHKVDERLG